MSEEYEPGIAAKAFTWTVGCASAVALIAYSTVAEAWVMTILWRWMELPYALSMQRAALLNVLVGVLCYRYNHVPKEATIKWIVGQATLPWFALLTGYLIKTWITR